MTDTLQAVEDAVQAHIASHFEGAYVDSFIVICHSQTIEKHDLSNYRIITRDTQPIHVDMGLIETGRAIIRDSWNAGYDEDEDD